LFVSSAGIIAFLSLLTTYPLQERILLDRDRVVSRTWYNEEKNRWEMDPVAVPQAVSKKLIEHVRIRYDWGAMYIALKGEDKEFYVNIKVKLCMLCVFYFLIYFLFIFYFFVW
jgi:hypothetical protein